MPSCQSICRTESDRYQNTHHSLKNYFSYCKAGWQHTETKYVAVVVLNKSPQILCFSSFLWFPSPCGEDGLSNSFLINRIQWKWWCEISGTW